MPRTEKQYLIDGIDTIQKWNHDRSIHVLFDMFYRFTLFDMDKNTVLWKEFREALAANDYLKDKEARRFLTSKKFAKQGYWWWDPENWTLEEE